METLAQGTYKIVRTLEDGQRVLVGSFEDLDTARKLVSELSQYWPGGYSIVPARPERRMG